MPPKRRNARKAAAKPIEESVEQKEETMEDSTDAQVADKQEEEVSEKMGDGDEEKGDDENEEQEEDGDKNDVDEEVDQGDEEEGENEEDDGSDQEDEEETQDDGKDKKSKKKEQTSEEKQKALEEKKKSPNWVHRFPSFPLAVVKANYQNLPTGEAIIAAPKMCTHAKTIQTSFKFANSNRIFPGRKDLKPRQSVKSCYFIPGAFKSQTKFDKPTPFMKQSRGLCDVIVECLPEEGEKGVGASYFCHSTVLYEDSDYLRKRFRIVVHEKWSLKQDLLSLTTNQTFLLHEESFSVPELSDKKNRSAMKTLITSF